MPAKMPFAFRPLQPQSLGQRLTGQQPRENAVAEINNLLAAAASVHEVTLEHIEDILQRYRTNWVTICADLTELYRGYLEFCLNDKELSGEEVLALQHLKYLFDLSDTDVDRIHHELAHAVYQQEIEKVVSDGQVTAQERYFLQALQTDLRLPTHVADRIYAEAAERKLTAFLSSATADSALSPDEETELQALSKSLGVALPTDYRTRELLDRCRYYWIIENGEIPVVNVDIKLQRAEVCYFTSRVDWFEERRVTEKIRYSGPTARVRIMKGVYWRVGDLSVQTVSRDVMTQLDSGDLYLTNKRLIFVGGKRNTTISLSKLLTFNLYRNGVELVKESGKNPFFAFDRNVELFGRILSRAMRA